MRDGVVHVEHVEVIALGNLVHPRRESFRIGWVLEQRIGGDIHLVVMNSWQAGVEADGVRVRDEVDVVSAGRQLQSELGGDDAAAAVSRVTGDPDPQWLSLPCLLL